MVHHAAEGRARGGSKIGEVRSGAAAGAFILSIALGSTGCGKVGEPVAPVPRTPVRTEALVGHQRGNAIVLTWLKPDLEQVRRARFRLIRFDIYRDVGLAASPPSGEPELSNRAQRVGSLLLRDVERIPSGQALEYVDGPLHLFRRQLLYAIRFVGEGERSGPFSNVAALIFDGSVPEAPRDLHAADQSQDVVDLHWRAPEENIDGSRPPRIIGYNLYRREAERGPGWSRLNEADPVIEPHFLDRRFEYGRRYLYMVRAIARVSDGRSIESGDARVSDHLPVDRFPPARPEGLTAGSANLVVSLFWAANAESDLAGYNIYRRIASDPPNHWSKLNAEPHALTTFRDERTLRGETYFYRITAVDRAGNESAPSTAVAQETN